MHRLIKTIIINRILIIQTAFVGDVILSTGVYAKLKKYYPASKVSFLVRKGNEGLIKDQNGIEEVLIWDKKHKKNLNLLRIIREVRKRKFDLVVNIQRHFSTGLITALSGAGTTIGFIQNPLSWTFSKKVYHDFPSDAGLHEVQRNNDLIKEITDKIPARPKLEFSNEVKREVASYQGIPYMVMAPASVWFTKQLPKEQWIKILGYLSPDYPIYLVGAPSDVGLCAEIKEKSTHPNVQVLAGRVSLEGTAVLIQEAALAFVNDSAPLHIASSANTPVVAFFCSTLPEFGFYPLSEKSVVAQISEPLNCRPCGLHGRSHCPESHFHCGHRIDIEETVNQIKKIVPETISQDY